MLAFSSGSKAETRVTSEDQSVDHWIHHQWQNNSCLVRRITKPQINAQTRTFHIYKPAYLWWRNANNAYCLTNSKLYSWQIFCDVRCTRNVPVLYCVNASTTNARFAWFCCWRVDLRKHSESRHRFLSLYISKASTVPLVCGETQSY